MTDLQTKLQDVEGKETDTERAHQEERLALHRETAELEEILAELQSRFVNAEANLAEREREVEDRCLRERAEHEAMMAELSKQHEEEMRLIEQERAGLHSNIKLDQHIEQVEARLEEIDTLRACVVKGLEEALQTQLLKIRGIVTKLKESHVQQMQELAQKHILELLEAENERESEVETLNAEKITHFEQHMQQQFELSEKYSLELMDSHREREKLQVEVDALQEELATLLTQHGQKSDSDALVEKQRQLRMESEDMLRKEIEALKLDKMQTMHDMEILHHELDRLRSAERKRSVGLLSNGNSRKASIIARILRRCGPCRRAFDVLREEVVSRSVAMASMNSMIQLRRLRQLSSSFWSWREHMICFSTLQLQELVMLEVQQTEREQERAWSLLHLYRATQVRALRCWADRVRRSKVRYRALNVCIGGAAGRICKIKCNLMFAEGMPKRVSPPSAVYPEDASYRDQLKERSTQKYPSPLCALQQLHDDISESAVLPLEPSSPGTPSLTLSNPAVGDGVVAAVIGGAAVASKWMTSRQQWIDPRHRIDPFEALVTAAGVGSGEKSAGPVAGMRSFSGTSPATHGDDKVMIKSHRKGGYEEDIILQGSVRASESRKLHLVRAEAGSPGVARCGDEATQAKRLLECVRSHSSCEDPVLLSDDSSDHGGAVSGERYAAVVNSLCGLEGSGVPLDLGSELQSCIVPKLLYSQMDQREREIFIQDVVLEINRSVAHLMGPDSSHTISSSRFFQSTDSGTDGSEWTLVLEYCDRPGVLGSDDAVHASQVEHTSPRVELMDLVNEIGRQMEDPNSTLRQEGKMQLPHFSGRVGVLLLIDTPRLPGKRAGQALSHVRVRSWYATMRRHVFALLSRHFNAWFLHTFSGMS